MAVQYYIIFNWLYCWRNCCYIIQYDLNPISLGKYITIFFVLCLLMLCTNICSQSWFIIPFCCLYNKPNISIIIIITITWNRQSIAISLWTHVFCMQPCTIVHPNTLIKITAWPHEVHNPGRFRPYVNIFAQDKFRRLNKIFITVLSNGSYHSCLHSYALKLWHPSRRAASKKKYN